MCSFPLKVPKTRTGACRACSPGAGKKHQPLLCVLLVISKSEKIVYDKYFISGGISAPLNTVYIMVVLYHHALDKWMDTFFCL